MNKYKKKEEISKENIDLNYIHTFFSFLFFIQGYSANRITFSFLARNLSFQNVLQFEK